MHASSSAARVPISQRCKKCNASDQVLTGDTFRKMCADRAACDARVAGAAAPKRLPCIYCKSDQFPVHGDGPRKRCMDEHGCAQRVSGTFRPAGSILERIATQAAPATKGTTAEAMIAVMQSIAKSSTLSGPFKLSDTLQLPLEAVQARNVLFGKPGCGKTNASAVIAENCLRNNIPVCILDILGNLWGLRASGTSNGLPIPIIGGAHGDLPLRVSDAELLAQLFAEGHSMLIDLSLFSTCEQQEFAAAFFREALRVLRRPAHLITEEAETVAPAFSRSKSQFASQGAATLFARQIRNFGVGWTFSTQRPQLLHPDIVDASSVFLPMQSTGDNAQRAILRESISRVGKMIATAILAELGQLGRGEAWLLPDPTWLGEEHGAPAKFRFRKRDTFDSTAVPKLNQALPPVPAFVPANLRPFAALSPQSERKRARAK